MSANWRKSSYSTGGDSNCVEVAADARSILVRDTTDRDGGTLTLTPSAWSKFIGTIRP
jgi:hypothetical protein